MTEWPAYLGKASTTPADHMHEANCAVFDRHPFAFAGLFAFATR